jgi:hypothetical protein
MNYECKTIPGHEDYEVDTNGRVWSFKSGIKTEKKLSFRANGYLSVGLSTNGKFKNCLVHRLIMLTFCGESNLQVNHIDGDKTNNNLTNLEYCTASENIRHAIETGLNNNKGESHGRSKLTKKDVMEIKTELLNYVRGMSDDLARKYGVSYYTITSIKGGKRWAHIKIN